jgi:hypothetical protein
MTAVILDVEKTIQAPVRPPAVLTNPGSLSIAHIVVPPHDEDAVVYGIVPLMLITVPLIVEEIVVNGHGGSHRANLESLLDGADGIAHRIPRVDVGNLLTVLLLAPYVVHGLIGHAILADGPGILTELIDRRHPTAITPVVMSVAGYHLLFGKIFYHTVVDEDHGFKSPHGAKSPAASTGLLVFCPGNSGHFPPVVYLRKNGPGAGVGPVEALISDLFILGRKAKTQKHLPLLGRKR